MLVYHFLSVLRAGERDPCVCCRRTAVQVLDRAHGVARNVERVRQLGARRRARGTLHTKPARRLRDPALQRRRGRVRDAERVPADKRRGGPDTLQSRLGVGGARERDPRVRAPSGRVVRDVAHRVHGNAEGGRELCARGRFRHVVYLREKQGGRRCAPPGEHLERLAMDCERIRRVLGEDLALSTAGHKNGTICRTALYEEHITRSNCMR
jgi:hypothetical protein